MRINKSYKLESIVSKDPDRNLIRYVNIQKLNGQPVAIATNGAGLVSVPCEAEESEFGMISPDEIIKARKTATKAEQMAVVPINGERPMEGAFPPVEKVIPTGEVKFTVSLDAKMLLDIAEALNALPSAFDKKGRMVTLEFVDQFLPIKITTGNDYRTRGAFGLLAPCRIG